MNPVQILLEILAGVLLIFAFRWMSGKKLGPKICRLLWLAVILRALIPFSLPIPYHPSAWFGNFSVQKESDEIPLFIPEKTREPRWSLEPPGDFGGVPPASPALCSFDFSALSFPVDLDGTAEKTTPNSGLILFGCWLFGFVAVLLTAVFRNRRIVARSTRQPVRVPDWVQDVFLELRERLRLKTWPVLIITAYAPTPCLVGAVRPRILIPETLVEDDADRDAVRFMLLHEMVHLKSGDIWFSWLWTLALAVHWFNPLFWLAGRWMKFDCEAACDERVLEFLENDAHRRYAESLVDIMQTLNPGPIRAVGLSAVIETPSHLERRLDMLNSRKTPTWKRNLAGLTVLALVAAFSLTGYGGQKNAPIPAQKARLMGYVEDYFMNNYRDITLRKSLEWGDVQTDKDGNLRIRYKYDALIWDKEKITENKVWTFKKNGEFVSVESVKGFPKTAKIEKPDLTTQQGVQRLVERFFSENFRDITARKTIRWEKFAKNDDGGVSIDYRYEATIWDKEKKEINQRFTFGKDGRYVGHETLETKPLESGRPSDEKSAESKNTETETAIRYLEFLIAEKYTEAADMEIEQLNVARSKAFQTMWKEVMKTYGDYVGTASPDAKELDGYLVCDANSQFENITATFRVTVDKEDKIAGFFIIKAVPRKNASKEKDASDQVDAKGSQRAAMAGWRLFTQGKADEAVLEFQEAVKLNPENANAYQGLGWSQFRTEPSYEIAKKTFAKCLELDPKNIAALNGIGQIAKNEGDTKTMLDAWHKAVDAYQGLSDPLTGLAEYYEKEGDKEKAAKYYQIWIKADPKSPEAKAGLERTNVEKKSDEKKDATKTKTVKEDPKDSQRAAMAGWRLFMQGKAAEAEPKFREAVELNPENSNAYQGLGWAQVNQGLTLEAKETFEKCLELDPKNSAALNGLGVIARNEGDEETMLKVWLKAVEVDKEATGPMAGLADYYEKRDDKENAVKYYKMWIKADPYSDEAKEGLKRVQKK